MLDGTLNVFGASFAAHAPLSLPAPGGLLFLGGFLPVRPPRLGTAGLPGLLLRAELAPVLLLAHEAVLQTADVTERGFYPGTVGSAPNKLSEALRARWLATQKNLVPGGLRAVSSSSAGKNCLVQVFQATPAQLALSAVPAILPSVLPCLPWPPPALLCPPCCPVAPCTACKRPRKISIRMEMAWGPRCLFSLLAGSPSASPKPRCVSLQRVSLNFSPLCG